VYFGTNIKQLSDFLPNIIAELIGIIIVVFFIERIYQLEKERERKRLEKIALNQLKVPLKEYFCIFLKMIIVTQPEDDLKKNQTIEECLQNKYLKEIRLFDIDGVWPDENEDCNKYLHNKITSFENKLNMIISKYAPYLSTNFLELVERKILTSVFLTKIKMGQNNFEKGEIINYYSNLEELIKIVNENLKESPIEDIVKDGWNKNIRFAGRCRRRIT